MKANNTTMRRVGNHKNEAQPRPRTVGPAARSWLVGLAAAALCAVPVRHAHAQAFCGPGTPFTESFAGTAYMDPATSVQGWGAGQIKLKQRRLLGFGSLSDTGLGLGGGSGTDTVPYVAGDDFNGDGRADLIAITQDRPNCLRYGANRGMDGLLFLGWDFTGDINWDHQLPAPPVCSNFGVVFTGDFDGDRRVDLMYVTISNIDTSGEIESCSVFRNTLTSTVTNDPIFASPVSCRDVLLDARVSWHWRSGALAVVDWDRDGADDIVVGSSSASTNEVLLFRATPGTIRFDSPTRLISDVHLYTPVASAAHAATENSRCPPEYSRGISAVIVEDFDDDGDLDIVLGSVSEDRLKYWTNNGDDTFTERPDLPFSYGAAAFPASADFDGDGDLDFVIGRNGKSLTDESGNTTCGGAGGTSWQFANDGQGNFNIANRAITRLGTDQDWAVVMDVDGDGQQDLLLGAEDGGGSPIYLDVSSSTIGLSPYYNTSGEAISKRIDNVTSATEAIVAVTLGAWSVSNVVAGVTTATLYVSNDNAATWEPITANEKPPTSARHSFTSFGSQLLFKVALTAVAVTADGQSADQTPIVDELTLSYYTVGQRRYTRSSVAVGDVSLSPTDTRELLFSASFLFPLFYGNVQAFDISQLTQGSASTPLERVDNHTEVSSLWNADEQLRLKGSSTRVLYTAYAAVPGGIVNTRLGVTSTELYSPTTSPTLQQLMALSDADRATVLDFLRSGMGSPEGFKLYDVGHSSPVLVGTPDGDADYLGHDYATFITSNATRTPMIYIGANDGFLHAFSAASGEELWAFVPDNLIAKLQTQRQVQADGSVAYRHGFFVDGVVVAHDIYDRSANRWRTVLFVGQALGRGRGGDNYYFALDVTNPSDPQPLWGFTDPWEGQVGACSRVTSIESEECGLGSGLRCCEFVLDGVSQQEFYCVPTASSCGQPDAALGETWSPPAPARLKVSGNSDRWAVFMGSGYNNRGAANIGRAVYAVDALNGIMLGRWDLNEIPTNAGTNPSTLENSVPGGVAPVDSNNDGIVDRVYFGDLEGRLHKIDTSADGQFSGDTNLLTWPRCVLFDAGDPDGDGTRAWAPVVTKPGVAFVDEQVNLYFGTGGDDRAPSNVMYRFYSIRDDDAVGQCRPSGPKRENALSTDKKEWIVGDGLTNTVPKVALSPTDAEGVTGERYWASPVIANNERVFFASLPGKIESVDPCENLAGQSKIFGYAIKTFRDAAGYLHHAGESIFSTPWIQSTSKVRQSVSLRRTFYEPWTRPNLPQERVQTGQATDVFVQEFSGESASDVPAVRRIADVGSQQPRTRVRIIRWREITL